MVRGLLMELDDHNCWTIAGAARHCGPHRLQHLLSRAVWDDQLVADIAAWAVSHLDDGDVTGAKVSLELTPIDNVTLSDRYYPGERALPPTGRVGQSLATAFGSALLCIPDCAYARTHAANAGQPDGVVRTQSPSGRPCQSGRPQIASDPPSAPLCQGLNSFQCPSETTSTVPSITFTAVSPLEQDRPEMRLV